MGCFRLRRFLHSPPGAPSAPTLNDLTISPVLATASALWTATISGATAGSTVTAVASGGTTLTVTGTGTTRTITGTFTAAGTPTVTLTETLTGATNTPHPTPPITVTVASGVILNIPNQAALFTALGAGVGTNGGKTFLLASATDFGGCGIYGYDFSANPIVIQGQTGSVFQWLEFDTSKGMTWQGANVYGQGGTGYGVSIQHNCAGLSLRLTYNTGTPEGTQNGNGIRCLQAVGPIVIQGVRNKATPEFAGRGNAVNLSQSSNITLKDTTVSNFSVDGILVAASDTITIDGNLIHDANYGAGDHPDGLQFFGYGGVPTSNITITNNTLVQYPGEMQMQGIFSEDSVNVVVRNNLIYGGTPTAIGNARGDTFLIDDNFCQGIDDGAGGTLGTGGNIVTRGGAANTTATSNHAISVNNYAADGVNPNYIPVTLPGTNVIIPAATWGDYTAVNAWLATHPTARGLT